MRLVPMDLCTLHHASTITDQAYALHFPPMATSVYPVKCVPGMHTAPCGDNFESENLSNNLKIHRQRTPQP